MSYLGDLSIYEALLKEEYSIVRNYISPEFELEVLEPEETIAGNVSWVIDIRKSHKRESVLHGS